MLVRLRHDREHGKRTNWLLIKRHDGYEREGDGDAVLEQDRSVASGRTMDEIAAGKGRSPKPFMLGKTEQLQGECGLAFEPRRDRRSETATLALSPKAKPPRRARKSAAAMPGFIAPQLCKSVSRPPSGHGLGA